MVRASTGGAVSTQIKPLVEQREPLSRERVVRAAVALADRQGIESVSMRKVG
ncbi:MAG: TetR/AcrR family transcriptional regulator, partial [Acidobacteria bacterium]|nr:TetR/AcrR family transcriptional regulator [Acidobacteriota bacterium]